MSQQQCAGAVLMVRPAAFGYNPETAVTNRMQHPPETAEGSTAERARSEFETIVRGLRSEGIATFVVDDTPLPVKPDAVFPNNWVSFHEDGTVVLYPMQAESRRRERRPEIVAAAIEQSGYRISRTVDLTHHEREGRYLEGTGSLVLDHVNRVAFAALSARTHGEVVAEFSRELRYEPVIFDTQDSSGIPLYHTNVLMCIGARAAIVVSEAIVPRDRKRVLERLAATGREIVELGFSELKSFAGNMLELATWDEALGDSHVLVMSAAARASLAPEVFARLSACTDTVLAVPLPTIERLSGGGVRCMLAEVFLPA